jgi:hypothetical protein
MSSKIIQSLFLIVVFQYSFAQIANPPLNLEECSDSNFAVFDLTINTPVILGSQDQSLFTVTYYETIADANNESNPIATPSNYLSLSGFQTIFARLSEDGSSTFYTTSFTIEVFLEPVINEISPLEICDDNLDGFAQFNLTSKNQEILNGQQFFSVAFYTSLTDAEQNLNPILNSSSFSNTQAFFQTVYIRVSNDVNPDCYKTSSLDLIALDCTDSDNDNVIDLDEDLNLNGNLDDDDTDMDNIPNYMDDDDDGDGVLTINEDYNNNGDPTDDDTDNSGVADYLEFGVALNTNTFSTINLIAYPNPSRGVVYIKNLNLKLNIQVYNIAGKQVKTLKVEGDNKIEIDLTTLPKGTYFIKIGNKHSNKVFKILKID